MPGSRNRPPAGVRHVQAQTDPTTIDIMENNEPQDNETLFEQASITCWERAVYHAERAEQMMSNLHLIIEQGRAAIEEQQAVAAAYLGLGGYGGDAAAYAELNIPYDQRDTEGYQ